MNTPKFREGQVVRRTTTGTEFLIIIGADKLFTEADSLPAYAYRRKKFTHDLVWVSSQKEMEDGRFEAVE